MKKSPYIVGKDKTYFVEEVALSILLEESVLFANSREFVERGINGKEFKVESETIVLFVNCNDVFAWACGDAETIALDEIERLYNM